MASKTRDTDGELGPAGGTQAVALPAAVETELLGNPGTASSAANAQTGFDVSLMDRFEFGFVNTGANSATLAVYYQYVINGRWYKDAGSGNAPTVTAGLNVRLQFINICARRVRVTATAAAGGTSGALEGRGMGYQ